MEAIYLQSMTDFVLEQKYTTTLDISQIDFYDKELNVLSKIRNYANFLKQPLQLGFFVPTDKNDNVLSEPERRCGLKGFDEQHYDYDDDELRIYEQAMENVLFKGFEFMKPLNNDKSFKYYRFLYNGKIINITFRFSKDIESLIYLKPEFSDSAIKQIGL